MTRRWLLIVLLVTLGMLLVSCSPKAPAEVEPAQAGLPNPASVYCEQQGGRLEIRQDASGGQVGICVFADGSECDEWAFFRGECQPGGTPTTAAPVIAATVAPTITAPTTPPIIPAEPPTAEAPAPTLAPTVLRVAYVRGNSIALWNEGEDSRMLAEAGNVEQVRISDDGQLIAYWGVDAGGLLGLHAVAVDGSNQRLLAGQDYLSALQPADRPVSFDFAPGSHTLYFVTEQYDLHRVDAAAGAPALVLPAGQGGYFSLAPDGQWLTLYHPDELALARMDGSDARVALVFPDDFRYTGMGPEIVWESDASSFYVIAPSAPETMTVWRVPVDGEAVPFFSYAGPYGAHLAPDGRSLVYLNYQHTPIDVHLVARDGSDTTIGAFDHVKFMGWAPDAARFLLDLGEDQRLAVPYLCAVGQEPVRLIDTDNAQPVVWVGAQRVLYAHRGTALYLQRVGEPSALLDDQASSWFDHTYVAP